MNRHHARRMRIVALGVAVAVLAACQPSVPPLTPKEQAHMNSLTDHMTTRCFGRYLIDLPVDMKPGKLFGITIQDVEIKVTPMPKAVFGMQLTKRKAVLQQARVPGRPDWDALKNITPLLDQSGVIFNRVKTDARGARVLELLGWKDGYAIKMQIDAFDVNFPEYKDDVQLQAIGSDVAPKLTLLQSLYTRTRGRADDQIPTEPGVCFQSGFVSGPASDQARENLAMDFVSTSMPDVMMHLESDSSIHENNTLLDRLDSIKTNLKTANGHIVRKGSRVSKAGLHFDEVLSAGMTPDDHVMGHLFTLEANSKIGSAKTPLIDIDFWNGQREGKPVSDDPDSTYDPPDPPPLVKASLSEAEAIALWDATTGTLQPRSGAF